MQPSNSRLAAPRSATRRYVIHRADAGVFILAWRGGQWMVEQRANGLLWREFTLAEFDASEAGRQLARQLDLALREAEADA